MTGMVASVGSGRRYRQAYLSFSQSTHRPMSVPSAEQAFGGRRRGGQNYSRPALPKPPERQQTPFGIVQRPDIRNMPRPMSRGGREETDSWTDSAGGWQ
jgi:hypothetical protein